jgi:hypothetical protein
MVGIKLEDFENGLGILCVIFFGDGGLGQKLAPLVGHASERASDRVKANVDLVYEIGRVTNAHEWGTRVNVILPCVKFVVGFEGEPEAFILGFQEETVRLEIDTFDIGDVTEVDLDLRRRVLVDTKDI